jgi:UDP:flavonoid glycosyltransferase YjiC (YdhE family)
LDEPQVARRAGELAAWARAHDGADRAATLVERFAASA